ncbi:MAG: response regulator transcription factor [Elusimicrobia bacterium]|nr:response regulator transcription factor [Elusimicrobiota bacterium]
MPETTEAAKESQKATSKKKSRVLVVDDHPVVREGLQTLIDQESDFQVCAVAATSREAMTKVESAKPDLAIVDFTLNDDEDGIGLIKALRAKHPDLPILVLSIHDETIYAERALRAGANGYLMKDEPTSKVVDALRKVLKGDISVSDKMAGRLLQRMAGQGKAATGNPVEQLSDRELQVFRWIARGFGTRQIAGKLGLSIKTIETYRENIKRKLDLHSGVELVRHAVLWSTGEKSNS